MRLWNYIEPGKYPAEAVDGSNPLSHTASETPAKDTSGQNCVDKMSSTRKRKLSGETSSRKNKFRRTSEKPRTSELNELNNHKPQATSDLTESTNHCDNDPSSIDNALALALPDVVDISECSNSSW